MGAEVGIVGEQFVQRHPKVSDVEQQQLQLVSKVENVAKHQSQRHQKVADVVQQQPQLASNVEIVAKHQSQRHPKVIDFVQQQPRKVQEKRLLKFSMIQVVSLSVVFWR